MDTIIVRYSEIALKGKNRMYFENKLVSNIKSCLETNNNPYTSIRRVRNRILIFTDKPCPQLKNVFGISSFSPAIKTKADLGSIKTTASDIIVGLSKNKTFRVSAKRLDKNFRLSSMEINRTLGAFIESQTKAKVSLKKFDFELGIEIIGDGAYLFTKKIHGFGGLPLGSEGKVLSLIENKASILASWFVMKRGCAVIPVAFKKIEVRLLKKFGYGVRIELKIIKSMQELKGIAEKEEARALVVNHTLDDFSEIDCGLIVLRPLIGFRKEAITKTYKRLIN
jgi:thiamine biosynthesis protein ThiI